MRSTPLVLSLSLTLLCTNLSAQLDWHFNPPPLITARSGHAMVFDGASKKTLLFGGFDGKTVLQDTWLWDGSNWQLAGSSTKPSSRVRHALAYDPIRKVVLLFGGEGVSGPLGDTWEWNGNEWSKKNPKKSPSPRFAHAMAFDGNTGHILLFGGFDGKSFLGDQWEWDGKNWAKKVILKKPTMRAGFSMTYDPFRKRVVLFGGTKGFSRLNDTWEWNGKAWVNKSTATRPLRREGHSAVFDMNRKGVVIFGGRDLTLLKDTWVWDGIVWKRVITQTTPQERFSHSMAFDPKNGVLIFGGWGGRKWLNDTFELNRSGWVSFHGVTFPTPKTEGQLAFYHGGRKFIEYIGPTSNHRNEWLQYRDGMWFRLPYATPIIKANELDYVFDRKMNRVFLFAHTTTGAGTDELFEFDGVKWSSRWKKTGSPFSGRKEGGLCFVPGMNSIFQFGGYVNGRTYYFSNSDTLFQWTGKDWKNWGRFRGGNYYGNSILFDPLRKELVNFIGKGNSSKVGYGFFVFDFISKKWLAKPAPRVPRYRQRLWWDWIRGSVMIYGGMGNGYQLLNDLWDWNGKKWSRVITKNPGPKRALFCVAHDPEKEVTLVFSGLGSKVGFYDIWELKNSSLAGFEKFGVGCMGSRGIPMLMPNGASRPWLGETFKTVTVNLPAFSGFAFNAVGVSRANWGALKLPWDLKNLGMPGCRLFVSPDILLPILNVGGKAPWSVFLPNDVRLKGKKFFVQTFVFDAKANKAGITISNAGEAFMGFRR